MKLKFSIKTKFISLTIIVIILANIIIGIRSIIISSKIIKSSAQSVMQNQSESVSNLVQDVLEKEFLLLEGLAQIPSIGDDSVSLQEKTELLGHIKNMNPSKYNNIGYCSAEGKSIVGPRIMDFSQRDLYKNAAKGLRYASEPSISTFQEEMWLMYYSVPVIRNGKFVGAVLSVVEGNDLDKIVSEIDIGDGYHPIVYDRNKGEIIGTADRSSTEVKENPALNEVLQTIQNSESGYLMYTDSITNIPMLVSYNSVKSDVAKWSVICAIPASHYLNGIKLIKDSAFAAFIVSLVLSVVLTTIFVTLILKPLVNVSKSMNDIASGNADLTKRIEQISDDEVGKVVTGFNSFTSKMQTIVEDIQNSNSYLSQVGENLDNSTDETEKSIQGIIDNISDIHKQIDIQSRSVTETAGAVNEIASNIDSLETMISKQASGVAQASNAVEQMIENINAVNQSVDLMTQSFNELISSAKDGSILQSEVNEKIEEIKNQSETLQEANIAIASIAEQTNLLAMNAAIEAAHAGEAGKGFSVVADEIRKLSETSSQQSKTIGDHLTTIQNSIQNVVDSSNKSSLAFENMTDRITNTDSIVQKIKDAMYEQTEGSKQISDSLQAMNNSSNEVHLASQEMAAGNKSILQEVSILQEATTMMKRSMQTVNDSAIKISDTGKNLTDISKKMHDTISEIGSQIDQFTV